VRRKPQHAGEPVEVRLAHRGLKRHREHDAVADPRFSVHRTGSPRARSHGALAAVARDARRALTTRGRPGSVRATAIRGREPPPARDPGPRGRRRCLDAITRAGIEPLPQRGLALHLGRAPRHVRLVDQADPVAGDPSVSSWGPIKTALLGPIKSALRLWLRGGSSLGPSDSGTGLHVAGPRGPGDGRCLTGWADVGLSSLTLGVRIVSVAFCGCSYKGQHLASGEPADERPRGAHHVWGRAELGRIARG
jgi:hypothetical protein